MVRDAQTIQADIERARAGLATAVDELSTRLDPKRALEQGKARARAMWADPKIKLPVVAGGALIAFLLVRKLFR